MPIFEDDLDHEPMTVTRGLRHSQLGQAPSNLARLSEESLPVELCEGFLPDSPPRPASQKTDDNATTSSREELIERLKRGESPTWIPNRHLDSMFRSETSPTSRPRNERTLPADSQTLLPAAQITPEKDRQASPGDSRLEDGLEIERPPSALHSGDFTIKDAPQRTQRAQNEEPNNRRVQRQAQRDIQWLATSPPRDFIPSRYEARRSSVTRQALDAGSFGPSPHSHSHSRSPSWSSSFAYQPPTSPLAHSESRDELDASERLGYPRYSPPRQFKRHTLYSSANSSPYASFTPPPALAPHSRSLRREGTFPFQAHQPRRSLNLSSSFMVSTNSPTSPMLPRTRRTSLGSESSPIHHASMVGSYEESILRGRMSTTPSKPLDFMAQIGVLGMGKCKPSLKCPSHVTLPFAAVYYDYSNTSHGRSLAEDGPSPYVGQVDLENGLPNQSDSSRSRRKAHSRYDRKLSDGDVDSIMMASDQTPDHEPRRGSRSSRNSGSLRAPPGGSYRIPEKGQLQIIIKNQNKTAVKLFLLPYDLAGMEPGTKTFIRQRCYSAGPVIDGIRGNDDPNPIEKPTLRYLIHLHICCPSKGRFYLYKSIRVVFANRVPDDKERLKNETTWPEPRFTPYKPVKVMNPPPPTSGNGTAANLVADKAFRRRSSGFPYGIQSQPPNSYDDDDHLPESPVTRTFTVSGSGHTRTTDPIPLRLPPARKRVSSEVSDATNTTAAATTEALSPESSHASRPSTKGSAGGVSDSHQYAKLNKGDLGYGGFAFNQLSPGSSGSSESLLSQRLRSLGVNHPAAASGSPLLEGRSEPEGRSP